MHNLLDFLQKYHHWFLFVFLEVISGVMLFKYNSYQGSVWLSSANVMAGKVYEIESGITSFFSMTRANEELTLRNFYLERQVAQLRRLYTDATKDTTVAQRNELQFLNQFKLIPAKVVSNTVNRPDNLITINKGKVDGVEVDMGVACGNGIVGVVYLVSDHYAVVIPALNAKSSRISCQVETPRLPLWKISPVTHISRKASGSSPAATHPSSPQAFWWERLRRYSIRTTVCRISYRHA